jgi:hypothetical protein
VGRSRWPSPHRQDDALRPKLLRGLETDDEVKTADPLDAELLNGFNDADISDGGIAQHFPSGLISGALVRSQGARDALELNDNRAQVQAFFERFCRRPPN